MNAFPDLPAPESFAEIKRLRIAIVSPDIAGPYHCGGVGAAYHGLALALANAGHNVTVVYTHPKFHQGNLDEWIAYFHRRGVRFVHLPEPRKRMVWYGDRKEASFNCYQWLREHTAFDVIHFPEWLGLGYCALAAKQKGLAFANTTICIGTHGPQAWSRVLSEVPAPHPEDAVIDFMERRSVELADVVISPSQYLLQWMRNEEWNLPPRTYVANNILPPLERPAKQHGVLPANGDGHIRELVFFGRLERRKGLPMFCDVVDHLQHTQPFSLTFLGARAPINGQKSEHYLRMRAESWNTNPTVLTSYGRAQALEYLGAPGRLAVIPSHLDNSPCAVQECLQEGIPFLASDRGGIPELVHSDDRERVTLPLEIPLFVRRLEEILREGQRPARSARPSQDNRERWIRWHQTLRPSTPPLRTATESTSGS